MTNAQMSPGPLSFWKRPLALPAAAFALGILAGDYYCLPAGLSVVAGGAALLATLLWGTQSRKAVGLFLAAVFFFGAGRYGLYTRVEPDDVSRFVRRGGVAVIGTVAADPDVSGSRARLIVRVKRVGHHGVWRPAGGRLLASARVSTERDRRALPQYGTRVALVGSLSTPSEPTNPGGFSYRTYLARQRVYCIMYIRSASQLRTLGVGRRNPAVVLAGRVRRSIASSIDRLMPQPYAGVAAGMALGTYSTLPDELFVNFSRTGTLHILAASGFNCAVLMLTMLLLFRLLRVSRRWAYFAVIPALILYMLVVGATPSIVRATIMAVLVSGAYLLGRISDPLNLLFAAALVILGLKPTDLFDVGFQLSFAAVMGIMLLSPHIRPLLDRIFSAEGQPKRRRPRASSALAWVNRNLTEAMLATTAATAATLPITAQYFNQMSLVSLPANAAVALLAPPIFIISLFAPVLAVIPYVGHWIAAACMGLIHLMLVILNGFGQPLWSCVAVRSPGLLGAAGYYIIVGTGFAYVSGKFRGTR